MQTLHRFLATLAVLAVSACGGGNGGAPFGGPGRDPAPPSGNVASDITVGLSAPSLNSAGSDTVTATVTAVDANRNTVSGIPVSVAVDNSATIALSGTSTNASGVVTGTIRTGGSSANRTITVTVTSGALVRTASLQVVGTSITGTPVPAVIEPSAAGVVQFRVLDSAANAVVGTQIAVTGPGGVTTTAVTGANGTYEYRYTAPAAAGTLNILAAAAGAELVTSVLVQSGPGAIPPVAAGSVRSASVAANPRVVAVNTSTATTNRAELRALFVGDSNAPIRNIRVRFDLAGDANSIGGTFSTGSTTVYSDANGAAVSAYIPGARFSPTDGLTVRACWDYTDFASGSCPNSVTTTLTVISDALSVTVGSDNLITVGDLVYTRRFLVQVNDSSGLPKADVLVSPLLDLPRYSKGEWVYVKSESQWIQTVRAVCDNEDLNRNGVLELYGSGVAEDADGDGQLEPRKADAVISFEGSNRTDASGQVRMKITYPQNVASWVDFNLLVAASGVAGTEGRATYPGVLSVPISVVKTEATPAFVVSPYGLSTSSYVAVSPPAAPRSALLCTTAD